MAALAIALPVESTQVAESLTHNLSAVEERLAKVLARTGRKRDGITLLAVTKVFPAAVIEEAYALGLREFGENYVQEFETKSPLVKHLDGARFHLIGHLQSNKARRATELFDVIQTVDSAKLARRLDEPAKPLDIMLEVKLSPEQSKEGASPEELPQLIETVRGCPNLRLRGLMTMPPWSDDPEPTRPYFRKLRELAEAHRLSELSMGMSHDFEVAVEEGSTCIRVGTALFGRRKRPGSI
jgi:PLP dependent protein